MNEKDSAKHEDKDPRLGNDGSLAQDEVSENALQDVLDEASSPERGKEELKKRNRKKARQEPDREEPAAGGPPGQTEPKEGKKAKGARGIREKLGRLSFLKSPKVDLRQPKYYFPLVVLLPLLFLGYTLMKTFNGGPSKNANVVRDSINMSLPEAAETRMADKMTSMNSRYDDHGGLTAVGGIGDDQEQKDSVGDAYLSHEADEVARQNAELARQQQMLDEQQRRLENSRRMAGGYASYGSSGTSRQAEMDEYRRDLEDIQRRSLERQRIIQEALAPEDTRENSPGHGEESGKIKGGKPAKPKKETLLVTKLQDANAGSFNTVAMTAEKAESMLIRAMIDKTTKAHEGTRLRFKLLDDVQIKDTKLKRGTYLYGTVTGFGQQRVRASITSILVGDKFLNVSLSVYDNDGMEGFYVPESAFRDMMREAGAQSLQGNINLNDGYSSELTGEAVALQALQNMYQSATSAVSANIRKNKARIKYNTIVYLINTENRE